MNNQAAQTMPEPEDWQKIHVLMAVMDFRTLTEGERKEMHEALVSIREAALSQTAGVAGDMAAAERLCRIYFEIAAEAIGEDSVRAERDRRISALAEAPVASAKYCSDERPCIPCFSDDGPCADTPNPEGGDSLLIRVYRPEGYEDVADEILLSDLGIHPDFRAELEAGRSCGVGEGCSAAYAVAEAFIASYNSHLTDPSPNIYSDEHDEWGRQLSSPNPRCRTLTEAEYVMTAVRLALLTALAPISEHQPRDAGQRARQILADEYERDGWVTEATACRNGISDAVDRFALRALARALSESAGGEPVPNIVREVLEWYASDPRIWVGWNKEGWAEEAAAKASGHYTFIGEDERGHNEYVPNHVRAEEALAAYNEWMERQSTAPARAPGGEELREYITRLRESVTHAGTYSLTEYEKGWTNRALRIADELEAVIAAAGGEGK